MLIWYEVLTSLNLLIREVVLCSIMDSIHKALIDGVAITKRSHPQLSPAFDGVLEGE